MRVGSRGRLSTISKTCNVMNHWHHVEERTSPPRTVLRDRKIRLLVESDDEDGEVVQDDVDAEDDDLVLPTDDDDGSESEVIESEAEDEDKEASKSDFEAPNRWNIAT
ncbi:unnamed protein product [Heligmosomoides polygyrus]|uniref:Nucleolin-like n=1 Tax=Heligmosomoides polygyrus TaxID=6339 RepID=A0A183GCF9_HELPZ|nr:unnamed protein product [Heligmosomoides polygyrus]